MIDKTDVRTPEGFKMAEATSCLLKATPPYTSLINLRFRKHIPLYLTAIKRDFYNRRRDFHFRERLAKQEMTFLVESRQEITSKYRNKGPGEIGFDKATLFRWRAVPRNLVAYQENEALNCPNFNHEILSQSLAHLCKFR